MVGHLVEDLVDHEHQMVWAVELEVAALLENWIVLHYYPTFPALVVTVVLAGVHRSAVTMNFALYFVLASQLRVVPARRRFAERTRVHTDWTSKNRRSAGISACPFRISSVACTSWSPQHLSEGSLPNATHIISPPC